MSQHWAGESIVIQSSGRCYLVNAKDVETCHIQQVSCVWMWRQQPSSFSLSDLELEMLSDASKVSQNADAHLPPLLPQH